MTDQPPPYPSYPGTTPQEKPYRPARHEPYGQSGRRPEPLKVLTRLTLGVAVAYTVLVCIDAALAWSAQARWLEAAALGQSALDFVTAYEVVSILFLPLVIVAYVITCLWLYRARANLVVLAPGDPHARSRGWVWGGWVVPVVNLWFPFQVVRDVARVDSVHARLRTTLGWWWGMWLTATVLVQVETRLIPFDEIDPDVVSLVAPVSAAAAVATVAGCVLWVRLVRAIAADQHDLLTQAGFRTR